MCQAKVGCAGGRTCHIAPRPCTEWKRPFASVLPFSSAWTDNTHCSAARARRKRACCASSRETASAVLARTRVSHAKAGCVLEAAADRSQHGLAPNRSYLAGAVAFFGAQTDHNHRSAERARVASARAAPHPERQPAQWWCARAFVTRKTTVSWRPAADTSQHRLATNGRPLAGAVAFRGAWTDHNHRGTARARYKRACCASSRETASGVVARPRVCHAKAGCVLEAAADTSQDGIAPNGRPLAGAVAFCGAQTDHIHRSAAQARRNRACCASSGEIASAVARPPVGHAKAGCVFEAAADTSQHGLAPNRRPPAGGVAFRGTQADHKHRSAARVRRKRAC